MEPHRSSSNTISKAASMPDKLQALISWLESNGGNSISGSIRADATSYGGRGLFANGSIDKGKQLIKISHQCLMNFSTVMAHITSWRSDGHVVNKAKLAHSRGEGDSITTLYARMDIAQLQSLSSFQIVTMFIYLENQRGSKSWWFPFIDSLPPMTDFQQSPLVWKLHDDARVKSLPRSTSIHCDKMFDRFNRDYTTVQSFVHGLEIDREVYLWTWFCVNSRCLYMEIPEGHDKDDNFTLAPYVDLINHSPREQCILKIDHTGFHVLTSTTYSENEELYLSYGPHSNEFLLCEYGFMLDINPWNDVDITSKITPMLDNIQVDFLKSKGYYGDYTMTFEDISFRIEVALAVIIEDDNKMEQNRRLNALLNGISDGSYYKRHSSKILLALFEALEQELDDSITRCKDETVKSLYTQQLRIVEHQMLQLIQ